MSWVCNVQRLACGAVSVMQEDLLDVEGSGWQKLEVASEVLTGKTSLWKRPAHMLQLTLRHEVCWCHNFMTWCLCSGHLNCGIALGQRKIKWFFCFCFFNFCFLLFSQLCGHRGTTVTATQFIRIVYMHGTIWGLYLSPDCCHSVEERNFVSYQPVLSLI